MRASEQQIFTQLHFIHEYVRYEERLRLFCAVSELRVLIYD